MSYSDHEVEVSTSSPIPTGVVHSSANRWLLLDGNRWIVAGALSAGVFATFVLLGWVDIIGVGAEDPVTLLLSVLIAGNLTLVPVTITINQLVLSREFGKPHEHRTRDQGVRELRRDLKSVADVALIPPEPAAFLRTLIETLEECAEAVDEAAAATGDEDLQHRAARLRAEIDEGTDRVARALDSSDFGSYWLLSAMLEVNSAWLIETTQYLEHDCGEAVPDEPFDRLQETLRLFNITRQYTKTLYAQKEIATLSRLLLYAGFFAVLVSSLGMLVYATPLMDGAPSMDLLATFSLIGAVAFTPLSFLVSYMLRLSTLMSYPPLRNSFITDG
ncbi:hypothetical protein ACFQMA_02535 [Halosimplex aquaticum]|uniref:Flagellar protein FlaJ n=1 Tax=Halosimplex aquaticum TaxID=3026162 RepID=A0ABD5XUE3_9EURY|nr:hypothetical protein [Halosimplex aquaticum]